MIMMTLVMALMLLIALAITAWPWCFAKKQHLVVPQQMSRVIYQQRFSELKQALQQGDITSQEYQQTHQDIKQDVLQDIDDRSPALSAQSLVSDKTLWLSLFIIIPILAALFYYYWGSAGQLASYYQQQHNNSAAQKLLQHLKTPQHVIQRLRAVVKQHPDDSQGWYLLGKLYLGVNQVLPARQALAKANQLKPNTTKIMLAYAQVLFLANKQRLTAKSRTLLQAVLAQQPDNLGVIDLLAANAYHQGHYQQAIIYWQRILAQLSPQSPNAQAISKAITHAKQRSEHHS
ncbi:MAG: c-type cytochrome biogenesis protein CcmI [Gammaproteobacteria bacterium]|nr:c-type cytochrome biogenesis protein CcmI [Gammaproteobacteria bacterium]